MVTARLSQRFCNFFDAGLIQCVAGELSDGATRVSTGSLTAELEAGSRFVQVRSMVDGSTFSPPGYLQEGLTLRPIWTPRGLHARGQTFIAGCRHCGHNAPPPLSALIAEGKGDLLLGKIVPAMVCKVCGSRRHHGYEAGPCPREG